jgi:hypothetical protein
MYSHLAGGVSVNYDQGRGCLFERLESSQNPGEETMSFLTPDIFLRPELLFGAGLGDCADSAASLDAHKAEEIVVPGPQADPKTKEDQCPPLEAQAFVAVDPANRRDRVDRPGDRPSLAAGGELLADDTETAMLIGVALLAAGVYFGLMARWRKERLPHHTFIYRRSLLRGGTGVMIVLLAFALGLLAVSATDRGRDRSPGRGTHRRSADRGGVLVRHQPQHGIPPRRADPPRRSSENCDRVSFEAAARQPGGGRRNGESDEPLSFREDLTVARGDVQSQKTSAVSVPIISASARRSGPRKTISAGRWKAKPRSPKRTARTSSSARSTCLPTSAKPAGSKAPRSLLKEGNRTAEVRQHLCDRSRRGRSRKTWWWNRSSFPARAFPVGTPLVGGCDALATGPRKSRRRWKFSPSTPPGRK